ncbi:MAG: hypothetical protein HQL52_07965 [Magnetococcales bacterium]|nr:hypothetical protein [Magnetococcales bacterium]
MTIIQIRWMSVILIFISILFITGPGAGKALADPLETRTEIEQLRQELKELRAHSERMEKKLLDLEVKQKLEETAVQAEKTKNETASLKKDPPPAAKKETIRVHGAASFGYRYVDHKGESHRDHLGRAAFGHFDIDFDAEINNILLDAQYRLYTWDDMIHHASVGYRFNDAWRVDGGILRVPFGKLPYASHDWWWGIPYYLGYEDDFDAGVQLSGDFDDWNMKLAFFKNGEYGDPTRTSRYSIDVIQDADSNQNNMENNQFNLYLTRDVHLGEIFKAELGASLQWGQLYNDATHENGDHWAGALHVSADYGPFNLILEGIRYEHDPKNPDGVSNESILLGGQGGSYLTAAKGWIWDANLLYRKPVDWGPINAIAFYENYSILDKDPNGWASSQINTIGMSFEASPFYIYMDYTVGKNAIWIGNSTDEPTPMTTGSADAGWNDMFLLEFGYYF